MTDDNWSSAQNEDAGKTVRSRWPLLVGLGVGTLAALLSISLESQVSLLFGGMEFIITTLLFPGLFGSVVISGNVHAFSLWAVAAINFVFYFVFVWVVCAVATQIVRRFR